MSLRTIACRDYPAHQSHHRLTGGRWICELCQDRHRKRTACRCDLCVPEADEPAPEPGQLGAFDDD